jgi:MSHA biogenesis protein MshJ
MKAWWTRQAVRIDALTLRERVILFCTILAAGVALADVAWLSPARTSYGQLKQRFSKQGAELERLREEIKAEALKPSPVRLASEELARLQTEVNDINRQISEASASNVQGTALEHVLEQFLRKHGRLTLVRTATLASDKVQNTNANNTNNPQLALAPGLSRTGLELTVSGAYADLATYVQTLEKALPTLRWGKMQLTSDTLPPQLTLQVYVIGVQP